MRDKEKQRGYVRKRQNRVRAELYAYKESTPCKDCGYNYPYYVMQFDHVRGKKILNMAKRSASYGSKKFLSEMKKCDLVCANCHAIRSHNRRKKRDR